jgi:nucleotide-binding universal stress UspA family protein
VPRPLVLVLVGIGVALAGTWLVVTAWQRARPPAVAEVKAFHVVSDSKIDVTLSVERPDPAVLATCRLIAQAQDLQLVGEQAVSVPPSSSRRVDVVVSMVTLRQAVSASVRGCTPS